MEANLRFIVVLILVLLSFNLVSGCKTALIGAGTDPRRADGADVGMDGDRGAPPGDDTMGDPFFGDSLGDPGALPHFSFFVTSLAAILELSGSPDGFGGDLRFAETGPGAGLRGADKICATIAERSMAGSSSKQWRAFLSVTDDGIGQPIHAIDRIGEGPWYDRIGRLLAPTKADLLPARPENGAAAIADDLPNEDGIPNHTPDPTQDPVDNHHMLTGSNNAGELQGPSATCQDWTTADGSEANGQPRCGFAWPRGTGDNGRNWKTSFSAAGCAAGIDFSGRPPAGSDYVGAGGGYGGFYCFALVP